MSLVVIFPLGKEAAASAYRTFCNENAPLPERNEPGYQWYPDDRVDAHGQRVIAYLGVGGRLDLTEEPEGGPAARVDGVLQEDYDHPDEDE